MAKLKEVWKNMNWLAVAGVVTVCYLGAVGFTLGWAEIWHFLTTTTRDDLNRVGDFVAGLAAPLALIWLMAAVLFQRQEIQDTRAQFATSQEQFATVQQETRDQFAKSQELIDEQLKMIRIQNAQVAQQQALAADSAKKAYKLSLFESRFQIYQAFITFGHSFSDRDFHEGSYSQMVSLSHEVAFLFDRELEEWFTEIAEEIHEFLLFKQRNPYEMVDDGLGNSVFGDTSRNIELQAEIAEQADAIRKHFHPDERFARFWRYLDVTDQPLVPG